MVQGLLLSRETALARLCAILRPICDCWAMSGSARNEGGGGREGGRERGMEGGRDGGKEVGIEGGREREREGWMERVRHCGNRRSAHRLPMSTHYRQEHAVLQSRDPR